MPVSPTGWVKHVLGTFKSRPKRAIIEAGFFAYLGFWHTFTSRVPLGMNIFDREWDTLVVLDACRVDALRTVAEEYPFIDTVESVWSRASGSHEWMARTFTMEYLEQIAKTAYVTPNGFADLTIDRRRFPPRHPVPVGSFKNNVVHADHFALFDNTSDVETEFFREYGVIPPRFITDRAIQIGRDYDAEKLIVHYYQPHKPYIARALADDRFPTALEKEPYDHLKRGETTKDVVWGLYLDNLRLALDEVELLLRNHDADSVVITADHGEAMGEFRVYGHPEALPHPQTRKVPWVETTGRDGATHTPDDWNIQDIGNVESMLDSVEDRLRQLGYKM